ncbi:conserved hypothetical protein [Methylobacterium sp. 4-46]|uniref:DUF4258 domain-containing protein n=1 Tax=unclassified Methylobacterium TaxID=2615210 RepID=UPI000165CDA9|nr:MULTISPECIES: DUF4258 domain-containing protein [unclassified Methylobacterium]ACA20739.1 conserved hypothetical protein [Methylobacterium sp. 4-46]
MMAFVSLAHARVAMAERQLDAASVERAVVSPLTTEPDPVDPSLVRAVRSVPERGGRVFRGVYRPEPAGCAILTAFLDRGRRRT